MKLLVYEWKKILLQRQIWILMLLLLVGNLIVLYACQQGTPAYYFVYQQNDNYVSFCMGNNSADEMGFYQQELQEQEDYQVSYKQFIAEMEERAKEIRESFLYEDANKYLSRNLYKTCRDFSGFSETDICVDNCFGINAYAQYNYGMWFVVIFLVLMVWYLLFFERNLNVLLLFKSCRHGHYSLAIAKYLVLSISGISYVLLQEIGTVTYLGWVYGYGNLERPLQSVQMFRNCCYHLTVAQALRVNIAIHIAITVLLGTVIFAIGMWIKSEINAILLIVVVLGGEYMLYQMIYLTGMTRVLKIINPFYYWNMKQSLGYYLNLNCLGYAVGKDFVASICAIFLIVMLVMWGVVIFHCSCQIRCAGYWEGFIQRLRRKWKVLNQQTNLLYFELYKLLIQQKKGNVILLLVAWAIYSIGNIYDTQYYASAKEAAYHAYLVDLAGEVTNEKMAYIENEKLRLQQIRDKISLCDTDVDVINKQKLQLELGRWEDGFRQVELQVDALMEKTGDISEKYFVDEVLYSKLWNNSDREVFLWFVGSVILLFLLAGIYTVDEESGVWKLCRTMRKGRETLERSKDMVLLYCSLSVYVIVEIPLFLSYVRIDSLASAGQELCNLVNWNCSSSITLLAFEGIVFALKGLSFILVARVGRKLARILKRETVVLLMGSGMLGVIALLFAHFEWSIHLLLLRLF